MFNTHKQGLLKETIRGILLEFVSNKCPNCGIQGKEGKKFCSQCGTKMGICPHEGCGAPLNEKPTQKFCSKCGGKLPITEADTAPGKDNASDNAEKKIKSVLDNSEMMRQAASRAFEKSNQLFIAISKRQKVYHNLYDAIKDKDKDRAESLKKELSAINQEIIKAATEDVDSYREFLSTVEAGGGQVPDNLKKSIEDKIENFRSQHSKDDESMKNFESFIDNAEKKLEKMDDPAEQEKEYIKWAKKSMIARDGTEFGAYIGAASAFFTNTGKEDLASKLGNKLQKMRSDSASEKRGLVMTKEQANQLLSSLGLNNWILEGNNRTAAGINWRNNMKIRLPELKKIIKEEVEFLLEAEESGHDVGEIIDNTPPDYFEKTLKTRNPGGSIQAGSVFSEPQTAESLKAADWSPLSHPAIKSPAIAFTANIPGTLGIVPAKELPPETPVKFQLGHGGAGGKSGKATEAVAAFDASLGSVDNTTLIAGPDRSDPKKFVVWTFHPGDPSPLSDEISIETVKEKFPDLKATVADAIELGFSFVKRVETLPESVKRRGGVMAERWQRLAGLIK